MSIAMSLSQSPLPRLDETLPLCRFREETDRADSVRCDSPVLELGETVHPDICRGCAFPDVASLPFSINVRSTCLYRGNFWRHAPRAHGADRGEPVEVFSCGVHGECTQSRSAEGVKCCASCEHFRPRDSSPSEANSPQNSVD